MNDPDPVVGLSNAAAAARLEADGYNELPAAEQRGVLRILFEVMRQPMFALLIAGGMVYLLLGDRVAADATLVRSHDLMIDESLLTGESVPVRKLAAIGGAGTDFSRAVPGGEDLRP